MIQNIDIHLYKTREGLWRAKASWDGGSYHTSTYGLPMSALAVMGWYLRVVVNIHDVA